MQCSGVPGPQHVRGGLSQARGLGGAARPPHSPGPLTWPVPADKDRDKAKDKYVRSLWKLYALHNQYVLALRAAELHRQHHFQRALPALHEALHGLHQEMALVL